jgi:hypothetical protein
MNGHEAVMQLLLKEQTDVTVLYKAAVNGQEAGDRGRYHGERC